MCAVGTSSPASQSSPGGGIARIERRQFSQISPCSSPATNAAGNAGRHPDGLNWPADARTTIRKVGVFSAAAPLSVSGISHLPGGTILGTDLTAAPVFPLIPLRSASPGRPS